MVPWGPLCGCLPTPGPRAWVQSEAGPSPQPASESQGAGRSSIPTQTSPLRLPAEVPQPPVQTVTGGSPPLQNDHGRCGAARPREPDPALGGVPWGTWD